MHSLPSFRRVSANTVVSATCILALLHFGRDFLEPLALALILSLVIAPLIRMISRTGLPHLPATLISVMIGAVGIVGISVVIASQLVAVTADLPQYSVAIQSKLEKVRELTERPFARIEADLKAVVPGATRGSLVINSAGTKLVAGQVRPVPVEIHVPQATATDTLTRLLSVVSGPIGEAGLVLVLMIFILLEHESLRDRIVRLTGNAEVGRTMRALGDATDGVSRFFFSQFVVNFVFGTVIGGGLWLAGVPHAALFGALSGLLRFVPYLGALVAGAVIALFVAAIDDGWSVAIFCVAMYTALELLVANVVEPKVYGHSSGLSPLAVIVSALFWGALWGPVGLLISTPLTLCLVVTGRHVRALEPISILLSDMPMVNAAQRFYHRILLGESELIIRDALVYLKSFTFASYCDNVLLPGLALGVDEFDAGKIEKAQQKNIRSSIAALAATIIPAAGAPLRRPRRKVAAGDDANVGAHLRKLRQQHLGRWQGSLDVPARSIVLCAGLPNERDELLNELFVLALREAGVDARSASPDDRDEKPDSVNDLVAMVFLSYPLAQSLGEWQAMAQQLRDNLPDTLLVTIRLLSEGEDSKEAVVAASVDTVLHSFEEGVEFVLPDRTG
ncbi:MAG TPA: AI-2E family transporter [Telluria sp.]|jgi:predicted PurR-regulated permease PerM